MQVFITSEEAEQGVNPMDINKGMRSYRFIFVFFSFFRIPKIYKGVNLGFFCHMAVCQINWKKIVNRVLSNVMFYVLSKKR